MANLYNEYAPAARQIAESYGIPPDLFVALITQESGWDSDVIYGNRRSSAGAAGIAQLMPSHWQYVDPFDPIAAMEYGARYLRDNYQMFGDWTLALAAYNAGPGNVQKYGGVPPFEETQRYVSTIMGLVQQATGGGGGMVNDPGGFGSGFQFGGGDQSSGPGAIDWLDRALDLQQLGLSRQEIQHRIQQDAARLGFDYYNVAQQVGMQMAQIAQSDRGLAETARQFDEQLGFDRMQFMEGVRQFDTDLAERVRQFDATLGEAAKERVEDRARRAEAREESFRGRRFEAGESQAARQFTGGENALDRQQRNAEFGADFGLRRLSLDLDRRLAGLEGARQLADVTSLVDPAAYSAFVLGGGGNIANALSGGGSAVSERALTPAAMTLRTMDQPFEPIPTYNYAPGSNSYINTGNPSIAAEEQQRIAERELERQAAFAPQPATAAPAPAAASPAPRTVYNTQTGQSATWTLNPQTGNYDVALGGTTPGFSMGTLAEAKRYATGTNTNPFGEFLPGDPRASQVGAPQGGSFNQPPNVNIANTRPAPMPSVSGPLPTQRGGYQDVRSDPFVSSYRSPTAFGSSTLDFNTEWTQDPATGEFIYNPTSPETAASEIRALMDLRAQLDARAAQRDASNAAHMDRLRDFYAGGGVGAGGAPQALASSLASAGGGSLDDYLDRIRQLRENVQYADLNPLAPDFFLQDPVLLQRYLLGQQARYGIPAEATLAFAERYRAPGVSGRGQVQQGFALGTRGEPQEERSFRSPFDDDEDERVSGTGLGRPSSEARFGFRPPPSAQLRPASVVPGSVQAALANVGSTASNIASSVTSAVPQFVGSFFGVPAAAPAASRSAFGIQRLANTAPSGFSRSRLGFALGSGVGFAGGSYGYTREPQFVVGDSPAGIRTGREETVFNPTGAPLMIVPDDVLTEDEAPYYVVA